MFIAFIALIISQTLFAKSLVMNIVDKNGTAVSNQVISIVLLGCDIEDNMTGYICVNDGELTAMTDNKGGASVALTEDASSANTVESNIWRSQLSPL